MTDPAVSLKLLVLKTRQVDRLLVFYQCLGILFTQEQHGKGPVHHAGQVAGVTLEIYPLSDDDSQVDRRTRLGFTVAHLEQVVKTLQANGTLVTSPPQTTAWGHRAVVQDPDGRAVELYQG